MKTILSWLTAGLIAAAFLMLATAYNNDAAARRYQAAAGLVREQAQARSDLLAGMLPYTVIVVVTLAIAGVIVYALSRPRNAPARIIELRTIILLQPGQSRRQLWQLLSGGNDDEIF